MEEDLTAKRLMKVYARMTPEERMARFCILQQQAWDEMSPEARSAFKRRQLHKRAVQVRP